MDTRGNLTFVHLQEWKDLFIPFTNLVISRKAGFLYLFLKACKGDCEKFSRHTLLFALPFHFPSQSDGKAIGKAKGKAFAQEVKQKVKQKVKHFEARKKVKRCSTI